MATAWREWVTSSPTVMHGQACIRGTRIPVSVVLGSLADGMSVDEIIAEYPSLSPEAIPAALAYGAALASEELLPWPDRPAEVRIKLDENMGQRHRELLAAHGHETDSVVDEGLGGADDDVVASAAAREGRMLVTLDLDFADIARFPPGSHARRSRSSRMPSAR
jgi:uncharacterized protein (DUF433 family)